MGHRVDHNADIEQAENAMQLMQAGAARRAITHLIDAVAAALQDGTLPTPEPVPKPVPKPDPAPLIKRLRQAQHQFGPDDQTYCICKGVARFRADVAGHIGGCPFDGLKEALAAYDKALQEATE